MSCLSIEKVQVLARSVQDVKEFRAELQGFLARIFELRKAKSAACFTFVLADAGAVLAKGLEGAQCLRQALSTLVPAIVLGMYFLGLAFWYAYLAGRLGDDYLEILQTVRRP
jgi:hypothetical protein